MNGRRFRAAVSNSRTAGREVHHQSRAMSESKATGGYSPANGETATTNATNAPIVKAKDLKATVYRLVRARSTWGQYGEQYRLTLTSDETGDVTTYIPATSVLARRLSQGEIGLGALLRPSTVVGKNGPFTALVPAGKGGM